MVKCIKCSREIENGDNICPYCGGQEEGQQETQEGMQEGQEERQQEAEEQVHQEAHEGQAEGQAETKEVNKEEASNEGGLKKNYKKMSYWIGISIIGGLLIIGILFAHFYKAPWITLEGEVKEASSVQKEESISMLVLDEKKLMLNKGDTKQLAVSIYPESAKEQPLRWESNNEAAIQVDQNGLITCLQEDQEAVITVSDAQTGSIQAICAIKVRSERESFLENVYWLNTNDVTLEQIDVYERLRKPNERDMSLAWDEKMFYALEEIDPNSNEDGLINGYEVQKKQLLNKQSGNLMEYEIYVNPHTKEVNKIVSIEYKVDGLEIIDYYYDKGKVNFIFKRTDSVYTPTYASPDKVGERYYFNNDSMVRWRVINEPLKVIDYAIKGTDKYKAYESLSQDLRDQYDQRELDMLNAAYNTYRVVLQARSIGYVKGYVTDIYGSAVAGATVKVLCPKYEMLVAEYITDETGYYDIPVPANGGKYEVIISKEGYISVPIYEVDINKQFLSAYQENVYLIPDYQEVFGIQILLCDALNKMTDYTGMNTYYTDMQRLPYATVHVRPGINNKTGGVYTSLQADEAGYISTILPAGTYTGEIISDGYSTSYFTIVVKSEGELIQTTTTPTLGENEVRIVLTWGMAPGDLDSHLFTPYQGTEGDMQHIGYVQKTDNKGNMLDVDDTSSYGPETMTIHNLENGSYKYYVADYSNCARGNYSSYEMSLSNAKVSVYTKDGLAQVFNVPIYNQGVIWEVFEIRNKQIVPIQRYYNNIEDKPWWNFSK